MGGSDQSEPKVSVSPVPWARHGLRSRLLAAGIRPRRPPVLVLSMPRSGSSWVGDMLGRGPDALYLREPVTQGNPAHFEKGTVFPPDDPDIRATYRRLADRAFLAWPDFAETIVREPEQWALADRRRRRLVIKEVNPRAAAWFLGRYRPRLVFLVRHPAAVTQSLARQGWIPGGPGAWSNCGHWQGENLREAWAAVAPYPERVVVSYEDLCADPLGQFRRLFEFTGLAWDDRARATVEYYSTGNAQRIDAWRDEVSPEMAGVLRDEFRPFDLPWYQADAEW